MAVSNRKKALLVIGLVALTIGAISIKVFRFQSEDCIKTSQEISFRNWNKNIL